MVLVVVLDSCVVVEVAVQLKHVVLVVVLKWGESCPRSMCVPHAVFPPANG